MLALLAHVLLVQVSHADYNICGEFATDCQPAISVQCPAYCSPAPAPASICLTRLAEATGPYDICVPYTSTGASTTTPQLQQGTGVPPQQSQSQSQSTSGAYPPPGTLVTSVQLTCTLYTALYNIIFILALALMALGGMLYAIAHVLPGVSRPVVQSYGMGLLIGGLSGVIIALLVPYLLGALSNIPDLAAICIPT